MSKPLQPALFLDRDGVVNVDRGYCHRIEEFEWVPGIFDTVRAARELGLAVVVATNQAGIARGLFTERDFARLTKWMLARFAAAKAPLDAVYHCPYHPDGNPPYNVVSPLRKPAPGMLLLAARELRLDLAASAMVGDQESDIEAGKGAGVRLTALFSDAATHETRADSRLADHEATQAWLWVHFGPKAREARLRRFD
jgi:D-glycero-D-manno-heptose 1,7-bisphosphate phosphatase